jgi:hypothetical protein
MAWLEAQALGVREHGAPAAASDAAERRIQAFSLFVRAYDEPAKTRRCTPSPLRRRR